VALRFADTLARDDGETAERLRFPRDGSTATSAIAEVRNLRERGSGPFWRRRRGAPIIGIGVGANKETKLWPRANFVALCRRMLKEGCTLAFIGGPQEQSEVQEILHELNAPRAVLNLCAASKIEDLGEILGELDAFVGLDTGTTHFAGRVGLPTFALFGASHDPVEWGPVGGRSGWGAADLECAGCSLSRLEQCPNDLACMTMLTPDRVWPTLRQTLRGLDHAPPNLLICEAAS
jgi:ADP-heptose:LPS heptosyltransferase